MKITNLIFTFNLLATLCLSQTVFVPTTFIIEDSDTHIEIVGALVTVRQIALTQQTLANGKVKFENVPVGEIEYYISKEGYQFETGRRNVSSDIKTNNFRIPISKLDDKKILVTGEVSNAEGGDLKDATIEVKIADQVKTAMSDAAGNYSIEIAPSTKFPSPTMRIEVKKGDCKIVETVEIPRINVVYRDFKLSCEASKSPENSTTSASDKGSSKEECEPDNAPYQTEMYGVRLTLCKCYYSNNKVICPLWLTNLTNNIVDYGFWVNDPATRIVLDYGKPYQSTGGSIMNNIYYQGFSISAKIPVTKNGVSAQIVFDKVQTSSKIIESLEIQFAHGTKFFSDVPLVHSTPPKK